MNSEIGSEFWCVEKSEKQNNLFPDYTKWFVSGQNALNYILLDIISKKSVKTVQLPSYCCESMIVPFLINGIDVTFYDVKFIDNKFIQDIKYKTDIILVMDYFGFESNYNYLEYDGIVIRDMTHSLFGREYLDANYYFGSLRKWTGIYTGGFAWSNELWNENIKINEAEYGYVKLREQSMELKYKYISNMINTKEFLQLFNKAEEKLDLINSTGIYKAYTEDINTARHLDVSRIKRKRRDNAQFLIDNLQEITIFKKMTNDDCPLFVPIVVKNRNFLKKKLIENKIYCPSHRPITKFHKLNSQTIKLYNNELSLVCDQRYSITDMKKLCEVIERYSKDII